MADSPKIFPLGDNCVTVDFGNDISVDLNTKAISLAAFLNRQPFAGFIEAVPAYSSVSIFYDLILVKRAFPEFGSAFDLISDRIRSALSEISKPRESPKRVVEIPVDFSERSAPDLGLVADYAGIPSQQVIEIFIERSYRVYMIGFLPGFAYMGKVDERIAAPRRDSPRLRVPKGSVGIASRQTGIYPLESPGGWQIIGRTDVEMFAPDSDPPSTLLAGDEVRFVAR